jgi:NADH-quinone oxidoreductase subunit N
MLGLFALPLVALAQTSIRRVLAVLLVAQASLPLAASLAASLATSLATSVDAPGAGASPASSLTTAALFTAGLGAAGLAIAVAALPALQGPEVTWEDVSGEGRRHPWRAGLLVLAAAQACGLPPATGFVVRFELAQRLAAQAPWVAGGLLVGAGLAAVPVVRLALFLFARAPRRAPPQPASVGPVVGLAVVVVLGVLVGVFGPR